MSFKRYPPYAISPVAPYNPHEGYHTWPDHSGGPCKCGQTTRPSA